MDVADNWSGCAGGAADGEKGKKDPEYKAKADAPKSAWTKPNAQVGGSPPCYSGNLAHYC